MSVRLGAGGAALVRLQVDLYKAREPLSKETVARIIDSSVVLKGVKDFVNLCENYAAAHEAGLIDRDHSYNLKASQFIRYYVIFEPLIQALRSPGENVMYWEEFERLVTTECRLRREKTIEAAARAHARGRKGITYS